jgi:hypothetical protein
MTVPEFYALHPDLKPSPPSFSEWVAEQLQAAREHGHKPRIAKFEALENLLEERQFLLARFWVPPSDEPVAERLMPAAEVLRYYPRVA